MHKNWWVNCHYCKTLNKRRGFSGGRNKRRGPLVGHRAEKLSEWIVLAPLVPIISSNDYEVFPQQLLHSGMAEDELTVRDSIVSGAAKRMTVHFPEEDGLAFPCRALTSLPEINFPVELEPTGGSFRRTA